MPSPRRSLSETHPALAEEAYGWDPTKLAAGSNKKLDWKCKSGHVWATTPNHRTGRNQNCPYCSGKRVLVGSNDLATTHPELSKQAVGWNPQDYSAGSNKKVLWKCEKGHKWTTAILHRTGKSPTGCPICSNYKLETGYNDLATKFPKIAEQADGWDPTKIIAGTNKKFSWKCQYGHKWITTVNSRTSSGTGCPVCANLQIHVGFNDLATTHPELAVEADGWDPTTVMAGSSKKLSWKCYLGHKYLVSPLKRTSRNTGCSICANKVVIIGVNDLATTHPELAKEAFGWDPREINAGRGSQKSGKVNHKRKWRCSLGHIWEATPASRTNSHHQSGCPYCSGNKNLKGFNDLASTHPEIAAEAYGWDPTESRGHHKKKHEWKCPLGHIYKQSITERISGAGCQYCSGHKLLIGFNDLKTINPNLAIEAFGWDPTTVTANSQVVKMWKCAVGHKWKSTVGNRNSGRGCPSCSKSGFDPNIEGWLYFLEHETWGMLQIGITNFPKKRLHSHKKLGWEIIEIRGPMDGQTVQDLETDILRFLKKSGAKLGDASVAGKFDGYSEAWIKSTYPAKSIKELLSAIRS